MNSPCTIFSNVLFSLPDVSLMLYFSGSRSQVPVKEVLPARKSLRLQHKEAEILTLPPEPRDTLVYEEVSTQVDTQISV